MPSDKTQLIQDLEPGTRIIPLVISPCGEGFEGLDLDQISFLTEEGYEKLCDGARPKHVDDQLWISGVPPLQQLLVQLSEWARTTGGWDAPCWQDLELWIHILQTGTTPTID